MINNEMIKQKILAELELDEEYLINDAKTDSIPKQKKEITGIFQFDEDIEFDNEFSAKVIDIEGNETTVYINPEEHSNIVLHQGEKYKILCEKRCEKFYAKMICLKKPNVQEKKSHLDKLENIAKIRTFSDPDGLLPLMLRQRNKGMLVELNVEGIANLIEEKDSATKFLLNTDKRVFECIIISNLALPNVPLKLKADTAYVFRGYLAGDGFFYITSSNKEYATDQIYENIPNNLISDFRQLTTRQKQEVLNLYNFYTNTEKKIEILSPIGFSSIKEYQIKFNLLRKFIPEEICKIIDMKLADQTCKSKQKLDILRTFLDMAYPPANGEIDIEKSMEKFRKKYFGHEKEARRILHLLNNKKGGCYIISGESKDFFIECIMDASDTRHTRIDVNTIEDLTGTSYIYDNCTIGDFSKNIKSGEVVILPDIDAITSENRNVDPLNPLIKILNNGLLKDNMIGAAIDVFGLGIKVFATISDVSKFSKKALSKLNVIHLPNFNESEREKICREFMFPQKLKELPEGTVVDVSKESFDKIANQYTIQNGLFEIESNIRRILETVEHQTLTEINSENLAKFLGIKVWKSNKYARDLLALKEKFMCHKLSYEQERARCISNLFKFYDEASALERREEILQQLRILVNILPGEDFSNLDLDKVEQKMNETHFNMENAKKHILNNLALRKCSSTAKIKPLLLHGSYGVGKTSIATAFADKCPTIFIPCQGMTRQKLVKDVAAKLSEACTSNAVIILEELDKISKGFDNPLHVIQAIIDGHLSTEDIGCLINVDGLVVLGTTNNIEEISPALLSRFDIVKVDGYSLPEKRTITKNYMLPKLLKTFNSEFLDFTEDAIDEIMLYSPEVGMRDVEKHLTNIIGTLIRKDAKPVVAAKDIREVLGEKPLSSVFPEGSLPVGAVKGMAVCGHRGVPMVITVFQNKFGDRDEVVGLAGESVTESVKVAKLLCERILNRKLPNLFVEFGDLSIKKEGTSAGLAIFVAMLSFALQQSVPSEFAFTGELSIVNGGTVLPVGVREKIKAAISDKETTKIYIPNDNYIQEVQARNLEKYDIEIVPIKHISEIVNELFDMKGKNNGD